MPARMPVNPQLVEMEYAVRGPIPQRAAVLKAEGREVIPCNIGNPQALGQPAITFFRQVVALLEEHGRTGRERRLNATFRNHPEVLGEIGEEDLISDYVIDYVERMLSEWPSGMGAYTESKGPLFIREAIARFIDRRDDVDPTHGVAADPESIFLTAGASEAVRLILEMMITDSTDGVMIPIPQYPIYSATIVKCGGTQVSYYPNEDEGWSLERSMLEESLDRAKAAGVKTRAIVVINPANPTGAILDEKSGREVVAFAQENGLAIIADEVYQENLYGQKWISFAKLVEGTDVSLFSLHSTSKGFYGECGHRGGYTELRNPPELEGVDASFADILLKQASVRLCSNTVGQALMYAVVNPPPEGSDPYPRYVEEKESILSDLYEKACMIRESFGQMEGVETFGRIGALYHFPRLNVLPPGTTDFDYCMKLLEATGLVTVNGAGFGQRPGTQHLRIAFLPPKEMLERVLPAWIEFHNRFVGS